MAIHRTDLVHGQLDTVDATTAVGALNNGFHWASAADFGSDIDVLNYALTLEYLEAEFYRQGNSKVQLYGKTRDYLSQIAADEASHVATITATIQSLGGQPVAAPGVDFGGAFDSTKSYLTTSHTFENKGVGAYLGAAGFIKDKMILQAAAGIFGVECRHAAIVGKLLGLQPEGGIYMGPFEKPLTKSAVLTAVKPFITSASAMKGDAAITL